MTVSEPRLEQAIKLYLAPTLRGDGFIGSGKYFRRVESGLIFVVNIQGSKWGSSFAINLGIHPENIPLSVGGPPNLKTIKEHNCELRRRLSESGVDQWWEYAEDQHSMDAAVKAAAQVYMDHGRWLFSLYLSEESPLTRVGPEMLESDAGCLIGFPYSPRQYLLLARIRMAQGQAGEAMEFARRGLMQVTSAASILRKDLEDLISS